MKFDRNLTDRQLFLTSQATSSLSNFVPLILSILTRDITLIGQVATFQSLLTIFISVTRSGIGFSMFRASGNRIESFNSRIGLLVIIATVFPATLFYTYFAFGYDTTLFIIFCLILLLSIAQEYVRVQLISSNLFLILVRADLVWLFASLLSSTMYLGGFTFNKILVIFMLGPACSLVYALSKARIEFYILAKSQRSNASHSDLLNLLAMPLITFITVFCVNIIWSGRFSADDIGMIRGLSFFFVPIQFIIGAFPLVVLKDKQAVSSFVTLKKRYFYLSTCAFFAVLWAFYSQILTFETGVIVALLTLSVHSVVISQETFLLQVSMNNSGDVVLLRLAWSILLILSVSFVPAFISTPVMLAGVIASIDMIYALTLRIRFGKFSESGSSN